MSLAYFFFISETWDWIACIVLLARSCFWVRGYIRILMMIVRTIIVSPKLSARYSDRVIRTFIIGFNIIRSQISPIPKESYLTY